MYLNANLPKNEATFLFLCLQPVIGFDKISSSVRPYKDIQDVSQAAQTTMIKHINLMGTKIGVSK